MCEQEASKSSKLLCCRNSSWPNRREWIRGQWQWGVSRFLPWLQSVLLTDSEHYWIALTLLMGAVRITFRGSCHRKLPDMKVLDSVFETSTLRLVPVHHVQVVSLVATWSPGFCRNSGEVSGMQSQLPPVFLEHLSFQFCYSCILSLRNFHILPSFMGSAFEMKAGGTLLFFISILSFWIIF